MRGLSMRLLNGSICRLSDAARSPSWTVVWLGRRRQVEEDRRGEGLGVRGILRRCGHDPMADGHSLAAQRQSHGLTGMAWHGRDRERKMGGSVVV